MKADRIAAIAERSLSLACWLAPGPRCPRILAAVLAATLTAGLLGALVYLLIG